MIQILLLVGLSASEGNVDPVCELRCKSALAEQCSSMTSSVQGFDARSLEQMNLQDTTAWKAMKLECIAHRQCQSVGIKRGRDRRLKGEPDRASLLFSFPFDKHEKTKAHNVNTKRQRHRDTTRLFKLRSPVTKNATLSFPFLTGAEGAKFIKRSGVCRCSLFRANGSLGGGCLFLAPSALLLPGWSISGTHITRAPGELPGTLCGKASQNSPVRLRVNNIVLSLTKRLERVGVKRRVRRRLGRCDPSRGAADAGRRRRHVGLALEIKLPVLHFN